MGHTRGTGLFLIVAITLFPSLKRGILAVGRWLTECEGEFDSRLVLC